MDLHRRTAASMTRREALGAVLGATLGLPWLTACPEAPRPPATAPPQASRTVTASTPSSAPDTAWELLDFAPTDARPLPQKALLRTVADAPLLVLLHGRGETRSLDIGARGWRDDYRLDRGYRRLLAPPLTADDLEGFVTAERLRALNQSLSRTPFRGLSLACPFTPDLIRDPPEDTEAFARFLADELVPRVGLPGGTAVGIDGVSLGGRVALFVGLRHPQLFTTVGAMQPALRQSEVPRVVELVERARRVRAQELRLVSSEDDPFLPVVEALSEALTKASLPHTCLITPGPHDYAWNRGPGSVETLLWHDRALRGEVPT